MKILIVDDEPILRQGLLNKIRQSKLEVTVIGAAIDGFEGLEFLKEYSPDIIITDIRMPEMDGLQFIENALMINPQLHFIIISGYNEFEYAMRAMKFGITDYLLKPIIFEELKNSILKLIDIIEQERKFKLERVQLIHSREMNHEELRKQYLSRLVQNIEEVPKGYSEDSYKIQWLQKRYKHYLVVVLVFESFQLPHYSFREGDENLVWFAVENIMSERMKSTGREGELFKHVIHQNEMVYLFGVNNPEENKAILKWLEDVLFGIQQYLKLKVSISLGTVVHNLEDIPKSYQQAKLALRNKVIHGAGKIYDYESIQKHALESKSFLNHDDERILSQWLTERNAASCQVWIEQRVEFIVRSVNSDYSQLEWFCIDLYLLFRKYLLSNSHLTEWLIGEMNDLLFYLQNLTNWQEAVDLMQKQASHIISFLSQKKNTARLDIVDEVKQHLETHFQDEITLQTISDNFFIHPNYFSRRFKEKFGESFHEYLTGVRMHAAAKWMRETDMKVLQIAELVGFQDAAHFSTAFRRFFQVSPTQYREQAQKG